MDLVYDPELVVLEDHVNRMGPMIDNELEKVDRRLAQLTKLSTELVDAMNLYHQLMREVPAQPSYQMPPQYGMPPQQPYMAPGYRAGAPPPGACAIRRDCRARPGAADRSVPAGR